MNRLLAAVVAVLATVLFPSVGLTRSHPQRSDFPVTIVDDQHTTVHLTTKPLRIISLDPRDTETLFALDAEKRIVADGSQYSEGAVGIKRDFTYPSEWPSPWGRDYPLRSKSLPHIEGGYGSTPFNLELIESLRPDLVLSLNSDAPSIQKLRDLGITVIVLDPANLKGIFHDIALIGRATGLTTQATTVLKVMKARLAGVKKHLVHVKNAPTVYYEIDATNPTQPYTAGPGTFLDEALRLARGTNVAGTVSTCSGTTCYPQIGLEALVKLNPGIILLGDAAYGETPAKVKARPGWSTIAAVTAGKVYPFNDELISRAGPRIVIGIEKLARRIHPEAFVKS